jgi:hypothetical protein
MMAGTKPPDFSKAISTLAPSRKRLAGKTKTRWGLRRQRAKSVLISDLLTTPQRARRMAVMMMVAMGVSRKVHGPAE